ncbi:pyridoxal-phosphate dependent enzyme [Paractinoplanes hotanensis]|uniref:ATP-grasp domain-containing protein n=1 Tax=Paractinoplanes hotanensis TaxID=2906497 RepID=A0ABT0YAP4_9ACTN|nr:pyridoxal-phosphate dependent enzyme [Actinoplanes hotanensis]MCM4083108.1 ATP-grasp domain-containing protein [Actinoplanes hotanensis]
MRFDSVLDAIGHTPLVRLRTGRAEAHLHAKLELQNLFAMKDRVAKRVVLQARAAGLLRPGDPIVESSSGTMALGLALVGATLGHPVHIVTDPRIDTTTLAKLRALGCTVHVVEAMGTHGWQSARLDLLEKLRTDLPGAFWPRQYTNPQNPLAYEALAGELTADLPRIDVLVGSVGSGGSLCGTARALRVRHPGLRVIAVDCVGSALFGQPDVPRRLQSGLGNSLHPENLDMAQIQEVHWLNDREAFHATRRLAREQQIFAGNSAGSVYHVMRWAGSRLGPETHVVGILPDRGDRYATTIYDDAWWAARGLDDLPLADEPDEVTYGTPVSSWAYAPVRGEPRRYVVFVEANTSGTGVLAMHEAAALGLSPVLLTADAGRYAGLADAPGEVQVCDTGSVDALRATIRARFRGSAPTGITTTSDFYLETVAALARCLHLPGDAIEAVATCRDKTRTRATLTRAGLPQPRYAVVRDPREVNAAVSRVGLPCVVKPATDSGSHGVRLCARTEDAARQATELLAITRNVRGQHVDPVVLVEEYVDGPEWSVETLADDSGIRVVGITEKHVGHAPYFVETGHLFPAPLDTERADLVASAAVRALEAAGLRRGVAHIEIRLAGMTPVVIEINPRPAGGMIPELIRLASGTNLVREQIRASVGLPADPPATAVRSAGVAVLTADRTGRLTAVTGTAEAEQVPGVRAVRVGRAPGSAVSPPRDAYGRLGHVIADGAGPAEVRAALDEAVRRIQVVVEPAAAPAEAVAA